MGIYLNPGNREFQISLNSEIYLDKSNLISYTNSVINTKQRYVCVSRPRAQMSSCLPLLPICQSLKLLTAAMNSNE